VLNLGLVVTGSFVGTLGAPILLPKTLKIKLDTSFHAPKENANISTDVK